MSNDPPRDVIAKSVSAVNEAVAAGQIRNFTCTGNTAEVEPAFWLALDAQGKRGLTLALANACLAQNSGHRITVSSSQSGRTLAEYSAGSYKVH